MTAIEQFSTLALEGRSEAKFTPVDSHRKAARLVTLEEHAIIPGQNARSADMTATLEDYDTEFIQGLQDRLGNVQKRIQIMDANNIGCQIISYNQPGGQAFTQVEPAIAFCRMANDFVFKNYCQAYPGRFFGFATLPTQTGQAAANELERCIKEYNFVGAMINGYVNTDDPNVGIYLDNPMYDPLWEVSCKYKKPIYIHPRTPLEKNLDLLKDITALQGAPWGYARETLEHVLRMMYFGVFDRFPDLKITLGHMGECLAWQCPRIDSTFRMLSKRERKGSFRLTKGAQGNKKKRFQEYFTDNIITTTSGMPRTSAFLCLLSEQKLENILFSVDYPYESIAEMRSWFDAVPISDQTWMDIGYRNAIKAFGLPLNYDCV